LVRLSSDYVRCVAFKPDNPNILVSCSDNITIKMWDISSGSCLSTLSCGSPVPCQAFKDNTIAAGCKDGKIKLFKLNKSQDWGEIQSESTLTGHSSAVTGVAFSADGQWLVSGSYDRTIRLWDARPGGATVVSAV